MAFESHSQPQLALGKPQQRLEDCYRRGVQLMATRNYEYAHTLFAQCVIADPARLVYLEAMLENLRAKYPISEMRTVMGRGFGGSHNLKRAVVDRQWRQAFEVGIALLAKNPWDMTTLETLADIAAQLRYNEVELAYLKQALDANPKDISINKHCARSLARMGQFDQAIACWHRVEKIRPDDREAKRMITRLCEEKQKYPGGHPPAVNRKAEQGYAPCLAPASESIHSESLESVLNPRQKLQQAIAADPHDVLNYLKLAELISEAGRFQEAVALLQRGLDICGQHSALTERLQQFQRLQLLREAALAEGQQREVELQNRPARIPWLEMLLLLTMCTLFWQLFPAIRAVTRRILDIRQWSRSTWFTANVLLLILFCAIYYRPNFRNIFDISRKQKRVKPVRR